VIVGGWLSNTGRREEKGLRKKQKKEEEAGKSLPDLSAHLTLDA